MRVGLIGMVTPNIVRWDAMNLRGCVVNDPVVESRKIVDQIRDDVDVLIGVMHMSVDNEHDVPHTGVRELAQACPEFDLIVAAHEHVLVEGAPAACLMDTAFVELIHEAQLYYSKADVSAAAYFVYGANVEPGPIRRCDVSKIYKYTNTLYTLSMTGAQIRSCLCRASSLRKATCPRSWRPTCKATSVGYVS